MASTRTPLGKDEIDYADDFAAVLESGATPYQEHFAGWIVDKTDPEFKTAKEREAFRLGALAGIRYRSHEQRSDENLEFHAARKAAKEADAAAKPARKAKAPVQDEPEEAPAPKRRGRPAKAAAAVEEAPARPARRTRRAAAADATETEVSAPAKPARRAAATAKPGRPARRGAAAKAEADF